MNGLWRPCLLTDRDEMSIHYREPSIDPCYQVSVHLAKRFQRISFFLNRPIRNKNCLWQPCLLTNRDEMSIPGRYFLPSFGSFGQAVSEENIFKNRPIRNKNCLWRPCLLRIRIRIRKLYFDSAHNKTVQHKL